MLSVPYSVVAFWLRNIALRGSEASSKKKNDPRRSLIPNSIFSTTKPLFHYLPLSFLYLYLHLPTLITPLFLSVLPLSLSFLFLSLDSITPLLVYLFSNKRKMSPNHPKTLQKSSGKNPTVKHKRSRGKKESPMLASPNLQPSSL